MAKKKQIQQILQPSNHFECFQCQDTGEYLTTVHGITDVTTRKNYITFKAFCSCKLGKQKALDFNNGLPKVK